MVRVHVAPRPGGSMWLSKRGTPMESNATRTASFLRPSGSPAATTSAPARAPIPRRPASSRALRASGVAVVLALLTGCGGRAARNGNGAYETGGAGPGDGAASIGGGAASTGGGSTSSGGSSADAGAREEGGTGGEMCGPGRAPLRRLTQAEFVKTVASLFGDASPLSAPLPLDMSSFPTGNLAEHQEIGYDQAFAYLNIARELSKRATYDSKALAGLAACAGQPNPDAACTRTTIESFAAKAFRRQPTAQEVGELLALHSSIAEQGGTFAEATRAVITAILQAPEFLYRIEWGTDDGPRPDLRRPTGDEMATRLSYLFWGTSPDEELRAAARSGALLEPEGIAKEAARLLDDPRSHAGLATFFNDFLGLNVLPQLSRSDPAYSPAVGATLQEATQRFLEVQIFDRDASWQSVLLSSKAFVKSSVANLYGVAGVTGDTWQEVSLDTTQRLGLLTHPSLLMARVPTNTTNPIQRGYWITENILCRDIPPEPPGVSLQAGPVPNADTTRERFTAFTAPVICRACHSDMNQLGYAFESFDSLGRYRTMEGDFDVDTAVNVTALGPTKDAVELVKALAALPETQACFAQRVAEFSFGKALATDPAGACLKQDIARRFQASGYNVRQLLLDLTQTDAFLYLPKDR
jgi:hypothetical protein